MIFDNSFTTKNHGYLVQYCKEKHHFLDFFFSISYILDSLCLVQKRNILLTLLILKVYIPVETY